MANGFFLGGFGEGLRGGLETSTGIIDRNRGRQLQGRQLDIQEEQTRQAQAAAARKPIEAAREGAMQGLREFDSIITTAAQGRGPEAALALLNSENTVAAIQTHVEAINLANQQLGGPQIKIGDVMKSLEVRARAEASAQDKGIRSAEETIAEADVISGAIGGDAGQRQANFANLVGISEGSQPEFMQLLSALGQAAPGSPEFNALQGRINRLSTEEGGGLSIEVGPDGSVRIGQGAAAGQAAGLRPISPTTRDEIIAVQQELTRGVEILDTVIAQVQENPGSFGATGSIRGLIQTSASIFGDSARLFPGAQNVGEAAKFLSDFIKEQVADPDTASELEPSSVGEVQVLESQLRFAYARTLQPEGKLLASTIEQAKNKVKLTGFTGSRQVLERLEALRPIFNSALVDSQRRLQLGQQGATEVEAVPSVQTPQVRTPGELEPIRRLKFDAEGNLISIGE